MATVLVVYVCQCSAMVSEVLSLYRCILRRGRRQIKYTDQSYFRRLVRGEFERNKCKSDPTEVKFHIQVKQIKLNVSTSSMCGEVLVSFCCCL